MKHNQNHTEDTKRTAVKESWTQGNTVGIIAKKYGVSTTTLQNWRRAYPRENTGMTTTGIRIAAATRRTVPALQDTSTGEVAFLRECLMAAEAELNALRRVIVNQEMRQAGYEPRSWRQGATASGVSPEIAAHRQSLNGSAEARTN